MKDFIEVFSYIFTNEYALDWQSVFIFSFIFWIFTMIRLRKTKISYRIIITLIIIYISNVIDLTLLPLPANLKALQEMQQGMPFDIHYHVSLLPFFISIHPINWQASIIFNLLNILMFIPMGVIIGFFNENMTWKKSIYYSFMISLSIECSQLLFAIFLPSTNRIFDIDDLVMNTLGGLLGFLSFKYIIVPLYKKVKKSSIYKLNMKTKKGG